VNLLTAAAQFAVERQGEEDIEAAAHAGQEQTLAGAQLIGHGQVQAHGVPPICAPLRIGSRPKPG
jgi:hypothetical protein